MSLHEYEKAENTYLKAIKEHAIPSQPLLSLIQLYETSNQMIKLKKLLYQLKQHNFDFNHPKHLKYQYYYHLTHHPNSDIFRIFLLKKALPLAKKQHDTESIHLFSKQLVKFYQQNRKYKEALKILYYDYNFELLEKGETFVTPHMDADIFGSFVMIFYLILRDDIYESL